MRQYIGARYVPTYYNGTNGTEWEAGVTYESLTVVTYLSASYTSKKTVPATVGNPYDNPEYWVMSANFPGQVGDLTNRVIALNGKIDAVEDGLEEEIETINEEISNISTGLTQRRFILIGDSYGMRNTPNWITLAEEYLNIVASNAVSGAGFGEDTVSLRFSTILQAVTDNLTTTERNSVTDIVICGGWNDARSLTNDETTQQQLQNRILDCVAIRDEYYPSARIYIGFIGWQIFTASQASEITAASLLNAKNVYNNTIRPALYHLQNCGYVMRNVDLMDNTYFHPNSAGATELFISIFGEMNGDSSVEKILYYGQNDALIPYQNNVVNGFSCTIATLNGNNHFKTSLFNVDKDLDAEDTWIVFNKAVIPFIVSGTQIYCNVFMDGTMTLSNDSTVEYHGTMFGIIGAFSSLSGGKIGLKIMRNGRLAEITHFTGRMYIEASYSTDSFYIPY